MNPYLIGALLLAVILSVAGLTMAWLGLFDRGGRDGLIDVRVTLSNSCPVEDTYFIAYAPESGRTARFSNGVANMRLKRGEILRLAIDPAYPAIQYAGYDEKASREVALVADCMSSERQNMITRTLRQQFGN
ncbi:hypothetical protein LSUCC0031_04460 [Rhodobacterales bacterium LSUCC0031]|nr:hypothetical protein [Rhodobacterales bacterium LSUCC0031]